MVLLNCHLVFFQLMALIGLDKHDIYEKLMYNVKANVPMFRRPDFPHWMTAWLLSKRFGSFSCTYRRLHLSVNARAKNMFSTDVKRLCFRCQALKFPRPNLSLRDLKRLCFWYQTLKFRHISVIFAGFFHIFLTTMTVNHESTDCLERISRLGGKNSKFDTWNINVWDHASSSLGGKTSKFDTWNIDVWRQLKTIMFLARAFTGRCNQWYFRSNSVVFFQLWAWAMKITVVSYRE